MVMIGKDYGRATRLVTRNPSVIAFVRLVEIMRLHQRTYRDTGLFTDRKLCAELEERVDDVLSTFTRPTPGQPEPDDELHLDPWQYTG